MNEQFADGLTSNVITSLQRTGKIPIVADSSVMELKGQHLPLDQIASMLHVSLLLQGTIAQVGSEAHITVELMDAGKNAHLWGKTYTYTGVAPPEWQEEIASEIAVDVIRRLTGSVPALVYTPATVEPGAEKAYLTGRYYWNQRTLPGMQKAIASFSQAISIHPRYAAAYAALAECYDLMTDRGVMPNDEAFHRAQVAAKTALSLDPSSAAAYNALAFATYRLDWDFERAEEYFKKAIALNPDYAVAHQWYGEFLGDMGRYGQSIEELRMARELAPLSPMVGADLADGYLHAGRFAEADTELKRILDLYPNFAPAHLYRIGLYSSAGRWDAAEAEARTYLKLTGDSLLLQILLIQRMAASGQLESARAALRRLLNGPHVPQLSAYRLSQLYFATQQTAPGYAELEQAYRERSWWLVTMQVDPGFRSVRAQPRFVNVARRVGLPVPANNAPSAAHIQTANWWPSFPH